MKEQEEEVEKEEVVSPDYDSIALLSRLNDEGCYSCCVSQDDGHDHGPA